MKFISFLACSTVLSFSTLSAQIPPPAAIIKFDKVSAIIGGELRTDNGIEANYLFLDEGSSVPPIAFGKPVSGDFTITAWIRPDAFVDEGKGGFSERSPVTVMHLIGASGISPNAVGYIRIKDRKLNVTLSADGKAWQPVSGNRVLGANQWVHLAVVVEKDRMELYIDGKQDASSTAPADLAFDQVVLGRMQSSRKWMGGLDSILIYNAVLTPEQVGQLARAPSARP